MFQPVHFLASCRPETLTPVISKPEIAGRIEDGFLGGFWCVELKAVPRAASRAEMTRGVDPPSDT